MKGKQAPRPRGRKRGDETYMLTSCCFAPDAAQLQSHLSSFFRVWRVKRACVWSVQMCVGGWLRCCVGGRRRTCPRAAYPWRHGMALVPKIRIWGAERYLWNDNFQPFRSNRIAGVGGCGPRRCRLQAYRRFGVCSRFSQNGR